MSVQETRNTNNSTDISFDLTEIIYNTEQKTAAWIESPARYATTRLNQHITAYNGYVKPLFDLQDSVAGSLLEARLQIMLD
jgi:hypothetical protein